MRVHPRSGLTAAQAASLHRKLLKAQRQLLSSIGRRTTQERQGDTGGVLDAMDAAAQEEQRSIPHLVGDAEVERLRLIDRALARFADGAYGVSERSGEPIGYGRLSVEPWAHLTIDEAQDLEDRTGRVRHSTM